MTSTTNLSDRCYIEMNSLEKATRSSEAGFSPHTLSCNPFCKHAFREESDLPSAVVHQYARTYFKYEETATCRHNDKCKDSMCTRYERVVRQSDQLCPMPRRICARGELPVTPILAEMFDSLAVFDHREDIVSLTVPHFQDTEYFHRICSSSVGNRCL